MEFPVPYLSWNIELILQINTFNIFIYSWDSESLGKQFDSWNTFTPGDRKKMVSAAGDEESEYWA